MARIMVVDDEPEIRFVLRATLRLQGHEVEAVGSGIEALERLAEGEHPDLIVLDVQMPGIDGWGTLAEIRRLYGEFGPRVMMCTVRSEPTDTHHGWSLGCDGYVTKPFDFEPLLDEVDRVLRRPPQERAYIRDRALGRPALSSA